MECPRCGEPYVCVKCGYQDDRPDQQVVTDTGETVKWGLVEPFGVDDGQLDGLTPAQCFTLGVEWQMFYVHAQATEGSFVQMVNTDNADRLSAMMQRHGRAVETRERYEGWVNLWVGPKQAEGETDER